MTNKFSKTIFLLLALLSVGCTKEVVVEEIVSTAWSDDSFQIAFYEARHIEEHNISSINIKNIEYRLGILDRNDGSKVYLSDYFRRSGREHSNLINISNKELQFKSSAGFVVARVGDSGHYYLDNVIYTADLDYIVYDLDGNILHQISKAPVYCDGSAYHDIGRIRVLASPDGTLIVKAESSTDCELEVNFLDPGNDFNVTEIKRISGDSIGGLFWVNNNNLLIRACLQSNCAESWVLVRPGQSGVISITDNEFSNLCLAGAIVRPDINSEGELISWNHPASEPGIDTATLEHYNDSEFTTLLERTVRAPDNPDACISIESFI